MEMNNTMEYLWTVEQLATRMQHADAAVRRWAVERFFDLYPEHADGRLESLLLANDDALILPTLAFLKGHRNENCLADLKRLFLDGGETIAIQVLATAVAWRLDDAVQWVADKIRQSERLGPDQIDAMITCLGKIRNEQSYRLLKATERSVKQRNGKFYHRYYSALLAHHRPEDLATVMADAFDPNGSEQARIAALAILFWETDPGLRASDVFFGNTTWVNKHLTATGQRLLTAASEESRRRIEIILQLLDGLAPDTVFEQTGEIAALVEDNPEAGAWSAKIAGAAATHLQQSRTDPETGYAEAILALSALLAQLNGKITRQAGTDAGWRDHLALLFRLQPVDVANDDSWQDLVTRCSPPELVQALEALLMEDPNSLAGLNAVMALGHLQAAEAIPTLLEAWERNRNQDFEEVLKLALVQMGASAAPPLMQWLATCPADSRRLILGLCSRYPTLDVVQAISKDLENWYRSDPDAALAAIRRTGAPEFLPFLQTEYREGEAALGKTYLLLCRVNDRKPQLFSAVERDVKRLARLEADRSQKDCLGPDRFPTYLLLKLVCNRCEKRYQYQVHNVHVHPPAPAELRQRHRLDFTPYRQGLVLADSLCCKGCGAWNDFRLSEESLSSVMTDAMRLSVLKQSQVQVPAGYPIQHVSYQEKDGKPLSLLEIEQLLQDAVALEPRQAGPHLALAKFQEYVKLSAAAKQSYLTALDLEPLSLESMAGLARLAELETQYREAYEWCNRCYENLSGGRVFLLESLDDFKKSVREKRREYAGLAGIKPDRQPVEIRFRIEAPAYPKNKPCPCGSGKKYKLCCLKKDQQQGG